MITIKFSGKKKNLLQIEGDASLVALARENFSVQNPAYKSNLPFVQPRLYCITPSGKFETGMLKEVYDFFAKKGIISNIEEEVKNAFNPIKNINDFKLEKLSMEFRHYQEKCLEKSILQGRGITVLPTAGGKTYVMACLIDNLKKVLNKTDAKTMVIVPSIQLVEQTSTDFLNYGLDKITKWSGKNKPDFENANIIIAGNQILLSKTTDLSILSDIDIFICDECHTIRKNNVINKIFTLLNTPYTFGFTGTMPPSMIDQWNIIGKFGPITYEEKTINLEKQDYISSFQIVILKIKHKNLPTYLYSTDPSMDLYNKEFEFLINNSERNKIICNLSEKMDNNTIIMVDRIDHGQNLYDFLISKSKKQIYFIRGSTEVEEREFIRGLMDKNNDVIIVAMSKIFSTGINIPNLHNIIFASAGKAKIKIMQSIGRALRLHPTKKIATIFDISDNTRYAMKHLKERKKLYDEEKYKVIEKEI
jgi:superfamily II DNA or RNA helicase